MLGRIGSFFTDSLNAIADLPNQIGETFKGLFIPRNEFFSDKFNALKTSIMGDNFDTSAFDSLKDIGEKDTLEITGTYMGKSVKWLDLSFYKQYKATIQNWLNGFYLCLLLLFNVRMISSFLRGHSPFKLGGDAK